LEFESPAFFKGEIMSVLNVTFAGHSKDVAEIDGATSDEDIRRLADEIIRTTMPWREMCLVDDPFEHFVVDRFGEQEHIYLRPKVPFGS
jgi:3-methyladenine DNA glycosylase AlkC